MTTDDEKLTGELRTLSTECWAHLRKLLLDLAGDIGMVIDEVEEGTRSPSAAIDWTVNRVSRLTLEHSYQCQKAIDTVMHMHHKRMQDKKGGPG